MPLTAALAGLPISRSGNNRSPSESIAGPSGLHNRNRPTGDSTTNPTGGQNNPTGGRNNPMAYAAAIIRVSQDFSGLAWQRSGLAWLVTQDSVGRQRLQGIDNGHASMPHFTPHASQGRL